MKKKKPATGNSKIRLLLSALIASQILIFSQCKKDEEELPAPETPIEAGVPDNGEIPDSTQTTPPDSTQGENPETTTPEQPGTPTPEQPSSETPTPPTSGTYTIKASETIVDGEKLKLAPGTTIILEPGTRGALLLRNISGTSAAPITIVNGNGKTTIQSSGSYGLKAENCTYFRLTGTGTSGNGILVDGGHIGVSMDKLTNQFTIDHIEVKNSGFAGIMAKTDPSCDQATWRGNFVMQNLKFYNNYVHDVKGEGFYVGNSFYEGGRDLECGNIAPHEIMNVEIYNNRTNNTGCEGIQAGCIISGLKIMNNKVENFGIDPFAAAQNNGIQIGEGSAGLIYNNYIANGPGNGIIMLGRGNTKIYNNLVVNPGSYGAFIDNRGNTSGDILFAHNTFINPVMGGLKTYNELVSNKFYNNIITGNAQPFLYGSGATGDEKNNLVNITEAACLFGKGYKLKAGSPAIDKGLNSGIPTDMAGKGRPSGAGFDIGCFEY